MKKVLAIVLTVVAAAVSTAATSGCVFVLLDEPVMPEELR